MGLVGIMVYSGSPSSGAAGMLQSRKNYIFL